MKTKLLPRNATAKAFAAQSARNLRWEGTPEVRVHEIDGMTGRTYRTHLRTRATGRIRCEVMTIDGLSRANLRFFYVR